jgi:RND family efflux transporter MFP subunit
MIKRINAIEGQNVAAGTVLAELDMEEINAQVQQASVGKEQAEIQLRSTQLMVEKLERDFAAVKALYEDQVATLTELKDTKSALDNAKNQVEAARTGMRFSDENQKIANYNQRLSKITAPTAGVILKRMAEPNEIVGPGTPVFFFGSNSDALVLKTSVTDKDIIHLNLGNTASVKFDAYPDELFSGTISEIAGIADPFTGTYEIEIALNRTTRKLLSGFIGEASVSSNKSREILSIPRDAMLSANGSKAKVFVVDNGVVRSKNIRIGSIQGNELIVLEGLSAGEQVITKGANYVAPNDSVNTEMK